MNKSGLNPVGNAVLVKLPPKEEKTEGGIILTTDTQDREQQALTIALCVSIGECAWEDYEGEKWCSVGDRVMFSKYAGREFRGEDDQMYRLVNDIDIKAVLNEGVHIGV